MRSATGVVTLASVLAGGAGTAVLWWWSRERLRLRAVVGAAGTAALVGLVSLVVLVWFGLGFFGVIHLAYLGLVLGVPILGAALVARSLVGERRPWFTAAGAVLLVPALVGFYATHVEPNRLVAQRVAVPLAAERAGVDPVRIAVLADLQTDHLGPFQDRVVERLLATDPDIILVPGDVFHAPDDTFEQHLPELQALLARLRAPGGVFVVQGDVDGEDRVDRAFATNPDARVLADEVATTTVGDRTLRIGGTRLAFDSLAADGVRRELEADPGDGSVRILLSHRPDTVFGLSPSSPVDLTVAGHTHGGQVVLPGFGPLVTMTDVPRAVAGGGLHEIDGNRIYVSPGVGIERRQAPQLRFNDPPTIGVVDLVDAAR